MYGRMDEWISGEVDQWENGWMIGRKEIWIGAKVNGWWVDGWMDVHVWVMNGFGG